MQETGVLSNNMLPLWIYDLLRKCDVKTCISVRQVCTNWHRSLAGPVFWRFMVEVVAVERMLYFPVDMLPSQPDPQQLFWEMWRLRDLWTSSLSPSSSSGMIDPASAASPLLAAPQNEGEMQEMAEALRDIAEAPSQEEVKFNIKVCARFRPAVSTAGGKILGGGQVILPLHQRVQLLQAANSQLSKEDALKQIIREQGRTPIGDPWAQSDVKHVELDDAAAKNPKSNSVGDKENQGGRRAHKAQVLEVRESTATVLTVAPAVGLREFSLDQVFDVDANQAGVYDRAARSAVVDVVNGYNASVIVYGQTGSGKTFTMFGEPGARPQDQGIVPRACRDLLEALRSRRKQGFTGSLELSYVEIFGGEVNDLLTDGGARQVVGQSRVAGQRYVLDGQTARSVDTLEEMQDLLARGEAQKRLAATAMNERSSRAHSVVMLALRQSLEGREGAEITSKLFLADLGGSEKLSKSKADENEKGAGTVSWEEYYENRQRLQEAANINKGLFALKQCIDALNDRENAAKDGRPRSYVYVPYQDSKLTMLLSSALGGNSKTVVLVTASLEPTHAVETLQTLRFAERCGQIENRADLSTRALREMLAALDKEVEEIEAYIKKNERWETRREVREDVVEGVVEGREVISKSVLVGAEEYRERLEKLLTRRREMLGEVLEREPGMVVEGDQCIALGNQLVEVQA